MRDSGARTAGAAAVEWISCRPRYGAAWAKTCPTHFCRDEYAASDMRARRAVSVRIRREERPGVRRTDAGDQPNSAPSQQVWAVRCTPALTAGVEGHTVTLSAA